MVVTSIGEEEHAPSEARLVDLATTRAYDVVPMTTPHIPTVA